MALITCPECNKKISDEARKCPQCGCKIPATLTTTEKVTGAAVGAIAAGAGTAAVTGGIGTAGSAAFLALVGHGIVLGAGTVTAITIGAPIAMFAAGAGTAIGITKLVKKLKRDSHKRKKMKEE